MRNDGRRSAHFGGLRERMVSLSSHLGGRFGGIGRFDKLSDRWGQGLGGVKRGRVVGEFKITLP